jgi:hypothetical protein
MVMPVHIYGNQEYQYDTYCLKHQPLITAPYQQLGTFINPTFATGSNNSQTHTRKPTTLYTLKKISTNTRWKGQINAQQNASASNSSVLTKPVTVKPTAI